MEVDTEPVVATELQENTSGGLDSDDDELRFDKDDDLYAAELDDDDALWVMKQHRPAAECDEQELGELPTSGEKGEKGEKHIGKGDEIDHHNDADLDEIAEDQPPTVSDNNNNGDADEDLPGGQRGRGCDINRGPMGVASDAQLSCPLCFTTVCLECQRHAKYYNQFRAVTGINVNIKYDEFLTLDQVSGRRDSGAGARKGQRKGGGKAAVAAAAITRDSGNNLGRGHQRPGEVGGGNREEEQETFHPVCCEECDYRVGVYDTEEVFHFFGVVALG